MTFAAKVDCLGLAEGDAREDGDPVVGLLAIDGLVDITQLFQSFAWKLRVFGLGFLQCQDVRLVLPEEP
jgi:hypothetical protein